MHAGVASPPMPAPAAAEAPAVAAANAPTVAAAEPAKAAWPAPAPRLPLDPFTTYELYEFFHGGELQADQCEHVLASAARARGALDVAVGEGSALRRGASPRPTGQENGPARKGFAP